MIIFYFLLLGVMLYGAKFKLRTCHTDYMSKSTTNATRGIFAFLIFMRHAFPYVTLGNIWLDTWFKSADKFLGQAIVCLFLFYTGFGIYESYKKNRSYFDTFLEQRLLKTLFNFDLAVMLFFVVQITVFQKFISLQELVKALIGLSSLGNSNWYMFYIFIAYIIAFVSFKISKKQDGIAIILVTVLTLIYIIYAKRSKIDLWWYDTALCVPLGMVYSFFKERIDKFMSNALAYYSVTLTVLLLYIGSTVIYFKTREEILILTSRLAFTLAYVFVTMKISMNNKILAWLGKYSFAIYVMQRIPMMILQKYCLPEMNRYVFVLLSLVFTVLLSFLFGLLTDAANKLFFSKTQKNLQ